MIWLVFFIVGASITLSVLIVIDSRPKKHRAAVKKPSDTATPIEFCNWVSADFKEMYERYKRLEIPVPRWLKNRIAVIEDQARQKRDAERLKEKEESYSRLGAMSEEAQAFRESCMCSSCTQYRYWTRESKKVCLHANRVDTLADDRIITSNCADCGMNMGMTYIDTYPDIDLTYFDGLWGVAKGGPIKGIGRDPYNMLATLPYKQTKTMVGRKS